MVREREEPADCLDYQESQNDSDDEDSKGDEKDYADAEEMAKDARDIFCQAVRPFVYGRSTTD